MRGAHAVYFGHEIRIPAALAESYVDHDPDQQREQDPGARGASSADGRESTWSRPWSMRRESHIGVFFVSTWEIGSPAPASVNYPARASVKDTCTPSGTKPIRA
jgi:hypothetical protein